MLTKGPNYREPRSTNFNKAFAEITIALDNCIENLASKTIYNVNNFDQWEKIILEKFNQKKKEKLETKMKTFFTYIVCCVYIYIYSMLCLYMFCD